MFNHRNVATMSGRAINATGSFRARDNIVYVTNRGSIIARIIAWIFA